MGQNLKMFVKYFPYTHYVVKCFFLLSEYFESLFNTLHSKFCFVDVPDIACLL